MIGNRTPPPVVFQGACRVFPVASPWRGDVTTPALLVFVMPCNPMRYFVCLALFLATLALTGCDFLGSDKNDGSGKDKGGEGGDQTLVVEQK